MGYKNNEIVPLIVCFYGDHHQAVKCGEIHMHAVTCFSQFDFFKNVNKSPPSVKYCFPKWSIWEGGSELFCSSDVYSTYRIGWAVKARRKLMEGRRRQGKCTGVGEGRQLPQQREGNRSRGWQPSPHEVGCQAGWRNIWQEAVTSARRAQVTKAISMPLQRERLVHDSDWWISIRPNDHCWSYGKIPWYPNHMNNVLFILYRVQGLSEKHFLSLKPTGWLRALISYWSQLLNLLKAWRGVRDERGRTKEENFKPQEISDLGGAKEE